jgi:hypothetical protein
MTTPAAPAAAKRNADAAPIPRDAPVTKINFPEKSIISFAKLLNFV